MEYLSCVPFSVTTIGGTLYVKMPNAALHLPLETGATQERRLEAVRCKALILIEAPSSAYHGGMLVVRKVPKKRRRPHAILHHTASILLRHRLACPDHGRLYPQPCRRDAGPGRYEGEPGDVFES